MLVVTNLLQLSFIWVRTDNVCNWKLSSTNPKKHNFLAMWTGVWAFLGKSLDWNFSSTSSLMNSSTLILSPICRKLMPLSWTILLLIMSIHIIKRTWRSPPLLIDCGGSKFALKWHIFRWHLQMIAFDHLKLTPGMFCLLLAIAYPKITFHNFTSFLLLQLIDLVIEA